MGGAGLLQETLPLDVADNVGRNIVRILVSLEHVELADGRLLDRHFSGFLVPLRPEQDQVGQAGRVGLPEDDLEDLSLPETDIHLRHCDRLDTSHHTLKKILLYISTLIFTSITKLQ